MLAEEAVFKRRQTVREPEKGYEMKKGQIVKAVAEGLHFPNRAVCRVIEGVDPEDNGTRIRVKNAIPGQTLSVRIAKMRHGNPEGSIVEVIKQGEDEYPFSDRDRVCPAYPACGGCMYQTLPYGKQLQLKEEMLKDLFTPLLGKEGFEKLFEGIVPSPDQAEYRNKMEFSFGDSVKDGPLELGMHKRGSFYDIVDAGDCRIVDSDFRQAVRLTRDYFRESGLDFFHRNSHEGYLRHLLVRKAKKTGQILIDLVTTSQAPEGENVILDGWKNFLLGASWAGSLTGILHTVNDRISDVVCDEGTDILYGQAYFEEELLGLHFKVTPFSFFQTNSLGAEELYRLAREYILHGNSGRTEELSAPGRTENPAESKKAEEASVSGGAGIPAAAGRVNSLADKTVYDLYSGTGTIAQILSPSAKDVVGVEIVPEAVEAAKVNARENGIENCRFLCGDVLKVLDTIEEKPDMIVLDPPRDGVHPKALVKILAYGVDEILYISCKPTSLARDLPVMEEAGYHPVRMAAVDMFPSTPNCEVLCLLRR
jgi:23S rRNA (uracil1939-C5)-methyltransferase